MDKPSEEFVANGTGQHQPPAGALHVLWPRLVDPWISAVIAVSFLIRVLGSHTAERVLSCFRHLHFS